MPGSRDDDRRRGSSGPKRGSRGRSDRARQDDRRQDDRTGRRRDGSTGGRPGADRRGRDDRGRDDRGRDDRPRRAGRPPAAGDGDRTRAPRPPIKGRRRTFDVESAPTERERARLEGGDAQPAGPEEWVDEGPVRRAAGAAVERASGPTARRPATGRPSGRSGAPRSSGRNDKRRVQRATKRAEQALEIDRARLDRQLGPARAARTIGRLGEAADAFADDRFEDARRILKPIVDSVPDEPAIRELYGLTLYRLGRWRLAAAELEEFARRSGSVEQHPVLADCYRALRQHARVEELWEELAATSPDAPTVAEGRIVFAGSLADQGNLPGAIAALEAGSLGSKKLQPHHLRMRYALGDLYDRAGEHQAARRHFEAVARAQPDFFDVADRLRQL